MRKILSLFVALIATTALWAYNAVVDGIYYDLAGDSATVTNSNGYGSGPCYSGNVVIPASITYESQVYRVTGISYAAFRNCSTLTAITIPTSMRKIYWDAFQDCSTLSTIFWNAIDCTTDNGSGGPFSGTPVSNLIFGSEVRSIPRCMFRGLTQLTSITIPENITTIHAYTFANCPNLKTVFWNAKNCVHGIDEYGESYGSPFDSNYSGEKIDSLTNIIFGNKVERIPAYLCQRQKNLKSISLPNSLKYIDWCAFEDCSGLMSLVIPDQVTTIGDGAFNGCESLENLLIGKSVDSIGSYAFERCEKLTSVTIPNSTRYIDDYAFAYCNALKTFTISNPNTVCGPFVLQSCTALETVSGPASLFNFPAEYMGSADYLPFTISSITITGGELDELGCLAITRNYKRLKYLDASAATNTTLADEAFMGCYNIETLKLPSNLERVPYMAVAGCKFLKSIDIPASVVEIEPSAFEDCRSIQTITFGGAAKSPARMMTDATSALKKIGNWAFYNAHELQNLTIPEGVEEIGDGAFYGCTYLQDLKLPSTVREIGDNCFALCSKMTKITVTSMTPPTIYAKTFYDVNRAIPVYVPDEAVDSYKGDTYWKEFDIRGGATGIVNVNENVNVNRKFIRDGQLYILRDGKTYNAQGGEL